MGSLTRALLASVIITVCVTFKEHVAGRFEIRPARTETLGRVSNGPGLPDELPEKGDGV